MTDPVKTCTCCAITFTATEWQALAIVGHQLDEDGMLELRNCSACISTIAMPLSMGPGTWLQSVNVAVDCARRDVREYAPAIALQSALRARDQLDIAIKQLRSCVARRFEEREVTAVVAEAAE